MKLRLNDNEAALVNALVAFTGEQKAALLRELLLEQARLVLAGEANIAPDDAANEVSAPALRAA